MKIDLRKGFRVTKCFVGVFGVGKDVTTRFQGEKTHKSGNLTCCSCWDSMNCR